MAGFIALFAIVNSAAGMIWGYTIKEFPSPFGSGQFLGSELLNAHQAGMIGVTGALLFLRLCVFRVHEGWPGDACGRLKSHSARLVGINVHWMIGLGWALAAAIGAVAEFHCAPRLFGAEHDGRRISRGFAGAVLGGLTSPLGSVLGGFLVGIFENLIGTYVPGAGNQLKLPIALFLIIAILRLRPQGLLGRTLVERV